MATLTCLIQVWDQGTDDGCRTGNGNDAVFDNLSPWTGGDNWQICWSLGVYGQMICVDPELKLVMVQTAANATAKAGETTLGKNADAFWRGVVRQYGNW